MQLIKSLSAIILVLALGFVINNLVSSGAISEAWLYQLLKLLLIFSSVCFFLTRNVGFFLSSVVLALLLIFDDLYQIYTKFYKPAQALKKASAAEVIALISLAIATWFGLKLVKDNNPHNAFGKPLPQGSLASEWRFILDKLNLLNPQTGQVYYDYCLARALMGVCYSGTSILFFRIFESKEPLVSMISFILLASLGFALTLKLKSKSLGVLTTIHFYLYVETALRTAVNFKLTELSGALATNFLGAFTYFFGIWLINFNNRNLELLGKFLAIVGTVFLCSLFSHDSETLKTLITQKNDANDTFNLISRLLCFINFGFNLVALRKLRYLEALVFLIWAIFTFCFLFDLFAQDLDKFAAYFNLFSIALLASLLLSAAVRKDIISMLIILWSLGQKFAPNTLTKLLDTSVKF